MSIRLNRKCLMSERRRPLRSAERELESHAGRFLIVRLKTSTEIGPHVIISLSRKRSIAP